jgi:hypothetical protein
MEAYLLSYSVDIRLVKPASSLFAGSCPDLKKDVTYS